jgi:hypothetical protein
VVKEWLKDRLDGRIQERSKVGAAVPSAAKGVCVSASADGVCVMKKKMEGRTRGDEGVDEDSGTVRLLTVMERKFC